jgi:hypothetical protein
MRVNKGACNNCNNDSIEIVEAVSGDQAVECQACKIRGPAGFSSSDAISKALDEKVMSPRNGRVVFNG